MTDKVLPEILDDIAVADLLDCDEKTIQEKARRGELPAVKFGRSWRFPRAALLQVLNDLALGNKPLNVPSAVKVQPPQKLKRRRSPPSLVSPI
jgi:excisionase family DNA binding protein